MSDLNTINVVLTYCCYNTIFLSNLRKCVVSTSCSSYRWCEVAEYVHGKYWRWTNSIWECHCDAEEEALSFYAQSTPMGWRYYYFCYNYWHTAHLNEGFIAVGEVVLPSNDKLPKNTERSFFLSIFCIVALNIINYYCPIAFYGTCNCLSQIIFHTFILEYSYLYKAFEIYQADIFGHFVMFLSILVFSNIPSFSFVFAFGNKASEKCCCK